MKDDSFNPPARGNGTCHMPEFVDGHHCQPTQWQECADQENLVEAFHLGLIVVVVTWWSSLRCDPAGPSLACLDAHTLPLLPRRILGDMEPWRWIG